MKPNNATLVVVGDTTLAEIKPRLEKLFASWKAGEVPGKNVSPVKPQEKSLVYLIDRPGALQSVIFVGEVTLPKANPQETAIEVMNDILGGTFSSRLNMNLREDKHWTYGVRSTLVGREVTQAVLRGRPRADGQDQGSHDRDPQGTPRHRCEQASLQ